MIDFIIGKIVEKNEDNIIIQSGNIGYYVMIPKMEFSGILIGNQGVEGEEIKIYTHHAFKEPGEFLFGFKTRESRAFFRLLISANGIGEKIAIGFLGVKTPTELKAQIASGDINSLKKLPKLGQKTAEKMVVMLKDKVNEFNSFSPSISSLINKSKDFLLATGLPNDRVNLIVDRCAENFDQEIHSEGDFLKLCLKEINS